jgi:hypothetical protein
VDKTAVAAGNWAALTGGRADEVKRGSGSGIAVRITLLRRYMPFKVLIATCSFGSTSRTLEVLAEMA